MLFALVLVGLLMNEARKPENYAWLWAGQPPGEAGAGDAAASEAPMGDAGNDPSSGAGPAAAETGKEERHEEGEADPITGPQDMLRRYGIDESRLAAIEDGHPVDTSEEETLLKILFRSKEFRLEDLERWAHAHLDPRALAESTSARRGEVYHVRGRLKSLETHEPWPETAERFLMPRFYRCEIELDQAGQEAVVYADAVPEAWRASPPSGDRVGALGFFLKLASEDPEHPKPVVAAHRMAWYPPGLPGGLGMDVGLLDEVKDKEPLLPEEREAFYQLLAAVKRAEPGRIHGAADQALQERGEESDSVVPLFLRPEQNRGRLVAVSGAARKAVYVRVTDPDIRARFGIDHYYEVSVFPDNAGGNPIFLCTPSLPEGMPMGEGPDYREAVRVAGFFMKKWKYRVPTPSAEEPDDANVWYAGAPLLIGPAPIWYPWEKRESSNVAGLIAGGLFVLAVVGIWIAVWRAGRGDRRFRETVRVGAHRSTTLGAARGAAEGPPDFSALEEPGPEGPPDRPDDA